MRNGVKQVGELLKTCRIHRMISREYVRLTFFFILLAAAAVLAFLIVQPYLITLAVSTTLAVVVHPVYTRLLLWTRGLKSLSAILTVLCTLIIVLIPLSFISVQVAQEARALYEGVSEPGQGGADFLQNIERDLNAMIQGYIPWASIDIDTFLRQALVWIGSNAGQLFSNTLQGFIQFAVGIVAFYYLLKDGDHFMKAIIALSPLSDKNDKTIIKRLSVAINSIMKGSLFIALLQGTVSGIGFMIFGIPSAFLWGTIAAVGALIPGVGTSIVVIPAVLYLFMTDHVGQAIGLGIWGATAVGLIDNFLGPILVGRGAQIHPLLIMFAVIGGIGFFGPLGFILGPLAISLLFALLDIYRLMINSPKESL